ncbi:MAG: sensor histidine kinase [Firmicutes bacterium]|nr:sensor histidine kinase [Bacillota bacterium]
MKRTSIRLRLMVLMICLTTLPVITVTWIATNNTRNSVEKEIINANNSRMMWADQYLNELIQQIDILFYTLQINQQLMASLNDIDIPDVKVQFRTQNYIRNTLASAFYANSRKVDNLTLYIHSNRKAFSVNFVSSGMISSLDIRNGAWSRMRNMPINMYFKQSGNGIYAFHSINRFEDRKLLGGLSVRINRDVWEEVSGILKSESESSVFLINDEGEMLSGSTKTEGSNEIQAQLRSLDLQHSELEFRKTKSYFYFMKRVGDGQLAIVKAIPLKTITQSARATITAGILTGSLFAAVSVLLSILVSLRISRPIVSLARTMRTATIHNFEMKPVQSRDEIGLLERGYNSMMQRIKKLIEDEYQKNIELKNAQLMALQAQINPHFLNNTLHLIGGMALSKNAPEIYRITWVIGDLLRYSISTEGDMVPLEDELKHMQNYIFIQEHRFAGRCTVTVSMDETVLDSKLPKFTIQPIVENAFEHGLQQKEGAWKVEIRIKRIGNRIGIMVKDDGVGLAEERLRQVRAELQGGLAIKGDWTGPDGSRKRRGIGLRNVNARLKFQFGNGYGARIFSKPKAGTLVLLVLPVSKEEDGADV